MTGPAIRKDKIVSLTYTLRNGRGEVYEQVDVPVSYLHGRRSGLFEKIEQQLEGGKLTVDANHPLAGQTVDFHVTVREVREVRDATPDELRTGQPAGGAPTLQ